MDQTEKRALFVQFNEHTYFQIVDDTKHLVEKHIDDLQIICSEWTSKYGIPRCGVSECAKSSRHYGRGSREKMKGSTEQKSNADVLYLFYESLFDRVHNFVFHLYDIGLRVDESKLMGNIGADVDADAKDEFYEGLTTDKLFEAELDHIRRQRDQCHLDLDRFNDTNNKYMMQSAKQTECTVTLSDALLHRLMKRGQMLSAKVQQMMVYFTQNEYDSDGIETDLKNANDSNICILTKSPNAVQWMSCFIRSVKCMWCTLSAFLKNWCILSLPSSHTRSVSTTCCPNIASVRRSSFSTGYIFNYWKEAPSALWRDKQTPFKMTVKPKHMNLRDEILDSGFLSAAQWTNIVVLKADQYSKSEAVRSLTAARGGTGKVLCQNNEDARLSEEYLYALILYCDFTVLCTAFSATFRLENVFESIESLMLRHSEFAHFGRLLVEVVLDFGINGYHRNPDHENGPYFCGINCPLNFGSYAICLKGPCSTSTQRTVALNFAAKNGVIIELNNRSFHAQHQRFFDCWWISNYVEESERLWIAGHMMLRVVTIVIVRNFRNYWKAMRALYLFDAMLSGANILNSQIQPEECDFVLISSLIQMTLNGCISNSQIFDSYFKNEWNLFLQRKRVIKLQLIIVDSYFKIMSSLMFHQVVKRYYWKILTELVGYPVIFKCGFLDNDTDNILKPHWISIFPELCTVTLNTGAGYGFRLESFVEYLRTVPNHLTFIIEEAQWIEKELNDEITALFAESGWTVEKIEDRFRPKWKIVSKETL